ncbi:uncharacterized protein LOC119687790 [Teleopsis dalmanni]|uniref:uncharacterized protein LOC119687790 n=1 Tax=Teleopsis dalmanni TaxID=139649 RepID=UPI0018CCFBDB|nr:uncharacterized protein LOC119687790 [Teleopsis dalmanni]
MAGSPYVKSLFWLAAFGGIGYGLLIATTPSGEKLERIKSSSSQSFPTVENKNKQLFMDQLKKSANVTDEIEDPTKKQN